MHTFSTKLLKSQKMDASLQEKRKQPKKKKTEPIFNPLSCSYPVGLHLIALRKSHCVFVFFTYL